MTYKLVRVEEFKDSRSLTSSQIREAYRPTIAMGNCGTDVVTGRTREDGASAARFAEFVVLASKRFTGCMFAPMGGKLHIYFPTDHFTMGSISYQDWGVEAVNWRIAVESRLIHNERYDSYRKQHHMVMTLDPKRALTNAVRYLRPHTPNDIEQEYRWRIAGGISGEDRTAQNKLREAKELVTGSKHLTAELRSIVASPYQFLNPDFAALVEGHLHAEEEHAMNSVSANMTYVRTYTTQFTGEQMFEVIHDIGVDYHNTGTPGSPPKTYTLETIPDSVAGKMALLHMLPINQYLAGVGMHVGEGIYYCHADPI